jgi:hypothetical protein
MRLRPLAVPVRTWRRSEQAAVFPAELGRALVPDEVPDLRDIARRGEQQRPGLLEPDLLWCSGGVIEVAARK